MKHVYKHTYQDGESITLSISTQDNMIAIACHPQIVEGRHAEEYRQWRDEVVLPDLLDQLEPEIIAMLMKKGIDLLGEEEL